MIFYKIILPVYTAIAARIHGGGIIANVPRQARNMLYAWPYFAIVALTTGFNWQNWHDYILPTLAFLFAFFGIDLGHYSFWYMGRVQPLPRSGTIEEILAPIIKIFPRGFSYGSAPYCITGMMIKGAFIGAGTLNPWVIAGHAVAWPVAYWVGMRWFNLRNDIAEALSGLFCGAALLVIR